MIYLTYLKGLTLNVIPNLTLVFLLQIWVEMTFSQDNLLMTGIEMNKLIINYSRIQTIS